MFDLYFYLCYTTHRKKAISNIYYFKKGEKMYIVFITYDTPDFKTAKTAIIEVSCNSEKLDDIIHKAKAIILKKLHLNPFTTIFMNPIVTNKENITYLKE